MVPEIIKEKGLNWFIKLSGNKYLTQKYQVPAMKISKPLHGINTSALNFSSYVFYLSVLKRIAVLNWILFILVTGGCWQQAWDLFILQYIQVINSLNSTVWNWKKLKCEKKLKMQGHISLLLD